MRMMKIKKKNYAAIDVGANAVRLLIKGADPSIPLSQVRFSKELLLRVPLRLGFDVFAFGKLSDAKAVELKRLMKAFRQLIKLYHVVSYRACATSALREAKNGAVILEKIEKDTGISIEIIDGKEEALLINNNHKVFEDSVHGNCVYVDVGGGSTEVNLLINGKLVFSASYALGTVRMLLGDEHVNVWQQLRNDMLMLSSQYAHFKLIGSGGNINKLFRLCEHKGQKRQRISVLSLQKLHDTLRTMSVAQREVAFHLRTDRADVILPAAEIYLEIASLLAVDYIYVPIIGLSDGIIAQLFMQDAEMSAEQDGGASRLVSSWCIGQ